MGVVEVSDTAVTAPSSRLHLQLTRFFSSAPDAPRFRRPTDAALLAVSLCALLLLALPAPGPTDVDEAITGLVRAIPGLYGWWWEISYVLLPLWTLILLVAAAWRRRRLLADLLMAAAIGLALAIGCGRLSGTEVTDSLAGVIRVQPPATYVGGLLALCTAIIVTSSPHLARPARNVGRVTLLLAAVGGVGLGIAWPIGMAAGYLVGVMAAAVVHLMVGSPDGDLTAGQVAQAVGEIGFAATELRPASRRTPGAAVFDGRARDGSPIQVSVYGRDARDNELLLSLWRSLWLRGMSARIGAGRLEIVEHEAVLTLLAAQGGVAVAPVLAVGQSADGDAVLVTSDVGRPWSAVPDEELTDPVIARAWHQVLALHELGLTHGAIDEHHLRLTATGDVLMTGLGHAAVADSLAAGIDEARFLVTTALRIGDERAVVAAHQSLGTDRLAAVLPYLQPAALDSRTRARIRHGDWDLRALLDRVAALTEAQPPPLQRLRRLRWRDVLVVAAGALLGWLVVSALTAVDWSSLWAELKSADWWWLAAALLASPLVGLTLAFSTLGASARPLRYWPTVVLQWAIQFMAVVLPSTAARLALDVRFFQRFGIAPGAAVSIGVIDSTSGFVVQLVLLLLIFISPVPGLMSPISSGGGSVDGTSSHGMALLILLLLAVTTAVVLLLPATRRRLRATIPRVRDTAREQLTAVRESMVVLRRPAKLGEMLVGNLGAQLLQAMILALCLHAYGGSAHFSQLILVNTLVSLFGGLMPVPGGVGVCEVALTAGLQAVGVPSAVALSTAVSFRLVTFYLPPLWGSAAMAWLRRREYV